MTFCNNQGCENGHFRVKLHQIEGKKIGYGKAGHKPLYHGASQKVRWK